MASARRKEAFAEGSDVILGDAMKGEKTFGFVYLDIKVIRLEGVSGPFRIFHRVQRNAGGNNHRFELIFIDEHAIIAIILFVRWQFRIEDLNGDLDLLLWTKYSSLGRNFVSLRCGHLDFPC